MVKGHEVEGTARIDAGRALGGFVAVGLLVMSLKAWATSVNLWCTGVDRRWE